MTDLYTLARSISEKEQQERMGIVKRYILTNPEAKEVALSILETLGYEVSLVEKISPRGCPNCGKISSIVIQHDGLRNLDRVKCDACKMAGPSVAGKREAVKRWNNTIIKA